MFSTAHIQVAWSQLDATGWITGSGIGVISTSQ